MQKQAERPQNSRFRKIFVLNEWSINCGKYKRDIWRGRQGMDQVELCKAY